MALRIAGISLIWLAFFLAAGSAWGASEASKWMEKGALARDLNQYDEAIDNYTKAIGAAADRSAEQAEAYDGRGMVYELKRQYGQAIADYNQAIAIAENLPTPQAALYLVDRARAYAWQGLYDKAIKDCDQAAQVKEARGPALYIRAVVYTKKGFLEAAVEDLEGAIKSAQTPHQTEKYRRYLERVSAALEKRGTTTTTTTTTTTLPLPQIEERQVEETDLSE